MSTLQGVISSPKLNRYLPWVAGAILLVGLAVFLGVKYSNTAKTTDTPLSNEPAAVAPVQKKVPLSSEARKVAALFLKQAVSRKDATVAWTLSGPGIRQGESLAAWTRDWNDPNVGVPIVPYKASPAAKMLVEYSTPSEAMLDFQLFPANGVKAKPQLFQMVLVKSSETDGKWRVDSWVPRSPPAIQANPDK